MIRSRTWFSLVAMTVVQACSSDSSSTAKNADGGQTGGVTAAGGGGSGSGGQSSTGGKTGASATGGTSATGGVSGTGGGKTGTGGSAVQASDACVKYCECMTKNCAANTFPEGCLPACASQTNWDLSCRSDMCGLVPYEPNNDHCTHAFGVDECLNK